MRYKATYRKKGHAYGGGQYTYQGVAEGGGFQDSFGNWWINFTTQQCTFGAVPKEDVTIGAVLSTEQYRDWLTESEEFAGERVSAEMEDRT